MLAILALAVLVPSPAAHAMTLPVQAPVPISARPAGHGSGSILVGGLSFCDGADLSACPCSNPGLPDSGCDNAQMTGGVSLAVLAQTTSPNGATLIGTGFPTISAPTAIVIRSNALDPASPVVFGDGLRCVNSSPLVRLAALAVAGGTSSHTFGHSAGAGAGIFYYQIWYRNTPAGFCSPRSFNLSNGRTLVW